VGGTPLQYYGHYNVNSFSTDTLLNLKDGRCGAWARLFLDARKVQGVTENGHLISITPKDASEYLLVKSWVFSPASQTSGNATYPYLVVPVGDGFNNAKTGYLFYYAEVSDAVGKPGQTNSNPKADFLDHAYVKVGSTYYDPSYGLVYTSLQDFVTQSVEGLAVSGQRRFPRLYTMSILMEMETKLTRF
jgi:hypothetical protein